MPTIIKWPGVTKPGSVCDEPVMGIDIYPTLIDITGLPASATDGVSLRPLLNNPDATLDRDLFWHFPHYHAGGDSPYTSIRSKNWRLIEFHEDGGLELYNLADDIGESKNRAESDPEVTAGLHKKIKQWRQQVDAQMPTTNPDFNPNKATKTETKPHQASKTGDKKTR